MTTQNIGLSIDLTKGIHSNTELFNGKIRLKKVGTTYDGTDAFASTGFWTSVVIDTVDKYTSLSNLAIGDVVTVDQSTYKAYTRTSDDNITWDTYTEINASTGQMLSVPKRYIQVKIIFTGKVQGKQETALDYNLTDISNIVSNEFVEMNGNLKLKKDYQYTMPKDNSWIGEGTLFRKPIQKTKFKKIDSLNLI